MPGVPHLAGQRLDYLRDALKQYRDGRRNVPVMRAAIGPVSDAELDALIRNDILGGLTLREPPPKDMPMPMVTRVTARRPS
jgi:hypothetical protein